MQLDKIEQIINVAGKTNFSIFELPKVQNFAEILPNSYHLRANDDKTGISIEQIRDLEQLVSAKQSADFYVVVEEPEKMSIGAINAFLKTLEEPRELVHIIFLTYNSTALLPTILSRAHCFYIPDSNHIQNAPDIDPKILDLAKSYIAMTPGTQLVSFADKIAKSKPTGSARQKALDMLDAAITLLYKSYFATGNAHFLKKLENLLQTEEAIRQNGNVKLQLIAGVL